MRWWISLSTLVLTTSFAFGDPTTDLARQDLRATHPGVTFYQSPTGNLTRVYGTAFSYGDTPSTAPPLSLPCTAKRWEFRVTSSSPVTPSTAP
jgi:hypothetical protein